MAPKGLTGIAAWLPHCGLKCILPAVLLAIVSGCSAGMAGTGDKGSSFSPFGGMVAFYRGPLDHLSAVRRGECPMFPSCSEYAREAVARHGDLAGWIMASDRLMRCGRMKRTCRPR